MSNGIRYCVGLENGIEGRSLAWMLEHPGCFVPGANEEEALAKVPQAIQAYGDWTARHAGEPWLPEGRVEFEVVETWTVYHIDRSFEVVGDGYSVESWFRHD
jgi:hypothetical protein